MGTSALLPLPPPKTPIKVLERLWLDTTCLYEEFHETLMADTDWDQMGKTLYRRRREWSPYLVHALPGGRGFNTGTTGSGVDWRRGLPKIVWDHIKSLDGDYTSLYHKHMRAIHQGAHHRG